jgi:hypothetical protein
MFSNPLRSLFSFLWFLSISLYLHLLHAFHIPTLFLSFTPLFFPLFVHIFLPYFLLSLSYSNVLFSPKLTHFTFSVNFFPSFSFFLLIAFSSWSFSFFSHSLSISFSLLVLTSSPSFLTLSRACVN